MLSAIVWLPDLFKEESLSVMLSAIVGSHAITDNITESDSSLNKSGSHTIADNITESDSSLNKSGSHAIADNITESDSSLNKGVTFSNVVSYSVTTRLI
jgi:hypothetical protein